MRPHHNTTSPKNLHGTWTWCFFVFPTFSESRGVAGCFGCPSWIPKSWGFEHPDDVTSTLILRWQVVSRWFQVFPGIFTLLGGWCSCSILRRLFCFQVAQPPTRISSNLIQWDVPNPRSGKTIFLPWMGYLNVYSPKILGRAALWMFYFDA